MYLCAESDAGGFYQSVAHFSPYGGVRRQPWKFLPAGAWGQCHEEGGFFSFPSVPIATNGHATVTENPPIPSVLGWTDTGNRGYLRVT
jgi:hypothetical protein